MASAIGNCALIWSATRNRGVEQSAGAGGRPIDQLDLLPHEVTKIAIPKLGVSGSECPVGVERITDERVVGAVLIDDRDVGREGLVVRIVTMLQPLARTPAQTISRKGNPDAPPGAVIVSRENVNTLVVLKAASPCQLTLGSAGRGHATVSTSFHCALR